ncbi:dynamin-binding protein-like, partial [Limulus polyphemus]|uniref:Dynamin-binding protein-like n=1 Tax=Limulus polyphemus TaxID=6850 RepID=A0ABM1RXC7_LIMPO
GASEREEVTEKNIHPGATCVCIHSYSAGSPGHLPLNSGDYVEVVGISDCGLLEGRLVNGQEGFFPSSCVREVKPRTEDVRRGHFRSHRVLPLRRVNSMPKTWKNE